MINPNELRIGNLLMWENEFEEIEAITGIFKLGDDQYYINFQKGSAQLYEFMPIPITPEWLLKLGFEQKTTYGWLGNGADYQPETSGTNYTDFVYNENGYTFIYRYIESFYTDKKGNKKSDLGTAILNGGNYYKKTNEGDINLHLPKYVHQLQNIYFSLTGKELYEKS